MRCFLRSLALLVAITSPFVPAQDTKKSVTKDDSPPPMTSGELEQLAAPIALYPDELVAQVLMASTYPLEVVEASRFVKSNPKLQGKALTNKLEKMKWDASVKSLVNFPSVLERMSTKLDWTQKLGDAVLAQRGDVMKAIQSLRKRAKDAGHLKTSKEQVVLVEDQSIVIQPTQKEIVYVPSYNPTIVYGAWPYPLYPPGYYYPRYYYPRGAAVAFATGVALTAAWGYAWGGCRWGRGYGDIDINVNRNINFNKNINRNRNHNGKRDTWRHNPQHRRGVRYRDNKTAKKFNRSNRSMTAGKRTGYRGRTNRSTNGRSSIPHSTSKRYGHSAFGGYKGRDAASRNSARGRTSRSSSSRTRSRSASRSRSFGGGRRGGGRRGGGRRR